ncbi:hypothetical protein P5V15_015403 [Pogonomyrmex californicus]
MFDISVERHWCAYRADVTFCHRFLEIGINVGPSSYVEITLGDHREQELILSLKTWKRLYEQRWNIYKLLRNDYKDNFISVVNCQSLPDERCYTRTS